MAVISFMILDPEGYSTWVGSSLSSQTLHYAESLAMDTHPLAYLPGKSVMKKKG
jgi:hypothetical protein